MHLDGRDGIVGESEPGKYNKQSRTNEKIPEADNLRVNRNDNNDKVEIKRATPITQNKILGETDVDWLQEGEKYANKTTKTTTQQNMVENKVVLPKYPENDQQNSTAEKQSELQGTLLPNKNNI